MSPNPNSTAYRAEPRTAALWALAGVGRDAARALTAFACAKLACLALLVHDGHLPELSARAGLALFSADARAALLLAALVALLRTVHARGELFGRACLVVIAVYAALNVPVMRMFSTPLTAAMLRATGSALGDSLATRLGVLNVLGVLLPLAAALACERLWRSRRRAWSALVVTLALGVVPAAWLRGRACALGLHENALLLLVGSELQLHAASRNRRTPRALLPAQGPVLDLPQLAGAAHGQHVVWVVLESTAARALHSYGASRDVMPELTRLAAQGLVFDAAYAAYPESIKGLYAMLCAREVATRSRIEHYTQAAAPCRSLAAGLHDAGYRTALFHSGRFAYLGMAGVVADRGFEVLADAAAVGGKFESSFGTSDATTVERALAWIDGLPSAQPFFLMFLPIAGHHPYHAPGEARRPFLEHSERDAYDNDLFVADQALTALVAGLRERERLDDTLLIISGDHGEAFLEHPGNVAHALFVYEENVHVPLLIRSSRLPQGLRVPQVLSTIDIAPTILALLGAAPLEGSEGHSQLTAASSQARFAADHARLRLGLRHGPWKFLYEPETGQQQLFYLPSDPAELVDRADAEPLRAKLYRQDLDGWL